MQKKIKKSTILTVAVGLMGMLGLNVLAYNHARAMMHYSTSGERTKKPENLSLWQKINVLVTGVNVPRPSGIRIPPELGGECRKLKLQVNKRITLEAWYYNQGKSTPLVILFHGYTAEKSYLLTETKELMKLGVSVMLVDFRGSGGSSESYTTIGVHEASDVAKAFRFATNKLPHPSIILFGQSMGAVAILRAMKEHNITPDMVILEAVFDTMLNTVRNRFDTMGIPSLPGAELLVFWGGQQWGFNGFRHNPVEYAKVVHCPSLFMHGSNDPRATLEEGRRVFDAVPGSKEFVVFDTAGHESYCAIDPMKWRKAIKKSLTHL